VYLAARAAKRQAVSEIVMLDRTPTAEDVVIVGEVTVVRNTTQGFEKRFQQGDSSHFVYLGDVKARPSEAAAANGSRSPSCLRSPFVQRH